MKILAGLNFRNVLSVSIGLLLIPMLSFAQMQLLDTAKQWNCLIDFGGPTDETAKITLSDTILNGQHYHNIRQSYNTWDFSGYLREHSGRVYYLKEANDQEKLLYDFTLQEGDTLSAGAALNTGFKVLSIDSLMVNGTYRKRWNLGMFDDSTVVEHWVEGIGSLNGLINVGYNTVDWGARFHLLCYYQGQQKKYDNPDYTECYYFDEMPGTGPVLSEGNAIRAFPNPPVKYLYFDIRPHLNLTQLRIIDVTGNEVRRITPPFKKLERIDVQSIQGGMYFYIAEFEGQKTVSGRFIKQ